MSTERNSEHRLSYSALEEILKLALSNSDTFLVSGRAIIDGECIATLGTLFQPNSTDRLKFPLFCCARPSVQVLWSTTQCLCHCGK